MRPEADVDEIDDASRARCRVDEQADLVCAERHSEIGRHVGSGDLTVVDPDAARDVDRDDGRREPGHDLGRLLAQTALPADPHDPVEDDVGTSRWSLDESTPRTPYGLHAGLVQTAAHREHTDPRTPAGQARCAEEGVAAVVTRAGEDQDVSTIDATEVVRARGGQASRRSLHEGAGREGGHEGRLGLAYLVDGVRVASHTSTLQDDDGGRNSGIVGKRDM
jgi:hypothetical protein